MKIRSKLNGHIYYIPKPIYGWINEKVWEVLS